MYFISILNYEPKYFEILIFVKEFWEYNTIESLKKNHTEWASIQPFCSNDNLFLIYEDRHLEVAEL